MDLCMEDPDSRDSGISVGADSEAPLDFAEQNLGFDEEMDDLELRDAIENLSPKKFFSFSPARSFRKGLADVTNRVSSTHFESPKTSKFGVPEEKKPIERKRTFAGCFDIAKRRREESEERASARRISLHRVQSTSVLERGVFAHDVEGPSFCEVSYSLETLDLHDSAAYRRISPVVLRNILDSMSEEDFHKQYVLVDCRYEFEYHGGHIKNSINVFDPERVAELFFPCEGPSRIPIFYCEYSQKRGPTMAHQLRRLDRERNEYPNLHYEEMYVVHGGYKGFYEDELNRNQCVPRSYTRMVDPRFKSELKKFSFHKSKSCLSMTTMRPFPPPPQLRGFARQTSVDSCCSPSRSSRRPLFATPETSPSAVAHALTFS